MSGFLPLKINVPLDEYRQLHSEAEVLGVTVAELVEAKLRKSKDVRIRTRGYTAAVGQQVAEARAMGVTWPVLAARFGVGTGAVRAWHDRYFLERESADERKTV